MNRVARWKIIGLAFCLVGGIAGAGVWWYAGQERQFTNNAYVQGNITDIAPKIPGYVIEVRVDDNNPVKAGDILFRIDDADYKARVAQAEANVRAQHAALANIEASVHLQHAFIEQAQAQAQATLAAQERAIKEHDRQKILLRGAVTTEQKFEDAVSVRMQADAAMAAARANVTMQQRKLEVLATQRQGTEALLAQAEASLALAQLDLADTIVRAPVDGVIGNRKVRVGRYVTTGTALLDIVPIDNVWIVANFKETQIGKFRGGELVSVEIDGYPGVILQGVVDSLAPGSGASFSLLPPDNATGNFVRVVQRVSVKIRLVGNPLPGRLVPGLSAQVSVTL